MKPIKFKEMNCTYAESQPEYSPFPLSAYKSKNGEVVSLWKLTLRERIKILLTGKLWISCLAFNKTLRPLLPTIDNPFSFNESKELKGK